MSQHPAIRDLSIQTKRRPRIWRRVAYAIMIVIVLAALGTSGVAYYIGWQLTHPKRIALTKTPNDFGMNYQDVSFPSQTDHVSLKGWLIPAVSHTDKIVIFSHGYKGNRENIDADFPTMKALHDAGFNVLAFDFRDEGQSNGDMVSVGYFEVRDVLGAVDFAKSHGYSKVGVIGFSMGASTALQAAVQDQRIQAVIADSPFANLYDYLSDNLPTWSHLPNWPFTPELLFEFKVLNGLDAHGVNPLGGLQHWTPRPLLLIAGTADDTIPMSNSQALYNEVKNNQADSLWIVPGAKHVKAYNVNPQAYEQKVTSFFETNLK